MITAGGRWAPSPGISYLPAAFPGADRVPIPDVLPHERTRTPSSVQTGTSWVPNHLTGPKVLLIGGSKFTIPAGAQVKSTDRSGTAWVRVGDLVFTFSALGLLDQTDADRRATPWDLL